MKNIVTVFALASAIFAGSASAAVASTQESHFGDGIQVETASHFASSEEVVVDDANIPTHPYNVDLYAGSH
jgi:hypothetical protein